MCSPQKGFLLIVPLKATRDSQRFWIWLRGVMHTAELDSAVGSTPRSLTPQWDAHRGFFFKFEYLSKIESEFKNTLACFRGPDGFQSWKKTGGRKSRDTLPSKKLMIIHTKKLQTFSMPNIMHAFDHLISAPEEYWYPSFPEYNTSLSVVPLLKFNLFKIKNIVAFELFF